MSPTVRSLRVSYQACQESLEPNITDLALRQGSLSYRKRRHWVLDEGMLIEKAPQRDILSPELDKRPE